MLRLLLPLVLLLLVLPVVAHWPVFARYGGEWKKEVPAILLCAVAYFVVWAILDAAVRAVTGSDTAGLVVASLLAVLAVPGTLWLGYKALGVPRGESTAQGVH